MFVVLAFFFVFFKTVHFHWKKIKDVIVIIQLLIHILK